MQRRRGPDGAGLWSSEDDRVVLGHRRLAIIDTGSSGAQPMSDATGRWVISFNGEIYNYRALRSELERLGCVFRTNSDTEVLINAVAQWGEAGLRKLRGMYAFALVGHVKPRAVARPRSLRHQAALCSGEPRHDLVCLAGARACELVRRLTHGATPRRSPGSIFGAMCRNHLPGGPAYACCRPATCSASAQAVPSIHAKPFHLIEDAYIEQPANLWLLASCINWCGDSIEHHLVADVPVGIFLSAGIDSSVIAALAAELGTQLRTVTLAFDEYAGTPDDEAPLAEATAKLLKSDHATMRIGRDEFEEASR